MLRVSKSGFVILLIVTICGACAPHGTLLKEKAEVRRELTAERQHDHETQNQEWLNYWPAVGELKGELSVETFFGPPNFGENPKTDSRETSWILSLEKPIEVRGKTDLDPGINASVTGVQKLQLVLPRPRRELLGKKVIVKGTLFHAHSGYHQTDVLMDVQSINLESPN